MSEVSEEEEEEIEDQNIAVDDFLPKDFKSIDFNLNNEILNIGIDGLWKQ